MNSNQNPLAFNVTHVVFLVLAVLHFCFSSLPFGMVYPVAWLALCSIPRRNWWLTTALIMSALGDVFGDINQMLPQIGFFAMAQSSYVILFWKRRNDNRPWRMAQIAVMLLVYCGILLCVLPDVPSGMLTYGICIYAFSQLCMYGTACLTGRPLLAMGGLLFVISDTILGINCFLIHVPYAHVLIMITYYAAQLLLNTVNDKITNRKH